MEAENRRNRKPRITGESYEQIVRKIFYECNILYRGCRQKCQNIYPYMAKHYMEEYGSSYLSAQDFRDLMERMGYKPFPNSNRYPLRVKKEYLISGFY